MRNLALTYSMVLLVAILSGCRPMKTPEAPTLGKPQGVSTASTRTSVTAEPIVPNGGADTVPTSLQTNERPAGPSDNDGKEAALSRPGKQPAPQSEDGLRLRFAISEITPNGEGGDRTRALIHGETDGKARVNPKGTGAGYRVDMKSRMSSPFSGSMEPTYWCSGAVHVLEGRVDLSGFAVDSDASYPLTFKLLNKTGLLYLCGRGTVTTKDGKVNRLGYEDTIETWLPHLAAKDVIWREAATQALGYLTKSPRDVDRVLPPLMKALDDGAFQVRRNAAESLGRIGDVRALQPLVARADENVEKDEWVRRVADEAQKIVNK